MKRLKKHLIPFLLCSILCFSFIPKTYAETIQSSNFLMYANTYDSNGNFVTQWEGSTRVNSPSNGGFPVFYGLLVTNLNISKACETEVTYRVDFQIWGWHNQSIVNKWVNLAKSIYFPDSDIEIIGTVITLPTGYEANFSVFFTWKPSYCPVDSLNSLDIRIGDDILKSPINTNYFYDYIHSPATPSPYYVIYNATYEGINKIGAENLVKEYYEKYSVTQEKLDSISGQIVDVNNKLDETNEKLEDIYTNITNDNINGAQNTANGFFDNFTDNDYGLSSIITIPLSSIQKITNATCTPINLPIPFTNSSIPLPCMYDLYEDNIPVLLNIWQIVSFGIISYSIIVDIFGMVKKFKDPNDDKLEVMDL